MQHKLSTWESSHTGVCFTAKSEAFFFFPQQMTLAILQNELHYVKPLSQKKSF